VVLLLFVFGARALGHRLPVFLAKTFAGVAMVAPLALFAAGIRYLLEVVLSLPLPSATIAGVAATVAMAAGIGYLRERETFRATLGKRAKKLHGGGT